MYNRKYVEVNIYTIQVYEILMKFKKFKKIINTKFKKIYGI